MLDKKRTFNKIGNKSMYIVQRGTIKRAKGIVKNNNFITNDRVYLINKSAFPTGQKAKLAQARQLYLKAVTERLVAQSELLPSFRPFGVKRKSHAVLDNANLADRSHTRKTLKAKKTLSLADCSPRKLIRASLNH